MTQIFNDGVLEAKLMESGWVFVRWVQNTHGRLQKQLIKDLNFMERFIFAARLKGWFAESELAHRDFHKLLIKFGAMPREILGEYQRFLKPIISRGDLHKKAGGSDVQV